MDGVAKEVFEVVQPDGGREPNPNNSEGKLVDGTKAKTSDEEGKDVKAAYYQ